jgi:hypothetical protein
MNVPMSRRLQPLAPSAPAEKYCLIRPQRNYDFSFFK